jgi:hypothetical protein
MSSLLHKCLKIVRATFDQGRTPENSSTETEVVGSLGIPISKVGSKWHLWVTDRFGSPRHVNVVAWMCYPEVRLVQDSITSMAMQ